MRRSDEIVLYVSFVLGITNILLFIIKTFV